LELDPEVEGCPPSSAVCSMTVRRLLEVHPSKPNWVYGNEHSNWWNTGGAPSVALALDSPSQTLLLFELNLGSTGELGVHLSFRQRKSPKMTKETCISSLRSTISSKACSGTDNCQLLRRYCQGRVDFREWYVMSTVLLFSFY